MSSTPLNLSPFRQTTDASRRLWPSLSRPRTREEHTKGADILGEYTLGLLRRTRARRLDWPRAKSVLAEGLRLADVSTAEFSSTLAAARDAAILRPTAPDAANAVFALAVAAIKKELGLTLHLEQILGALAMADGCCAELATGEGKTLTAILPAALRAFPGRGVHVITVNDYLAKRDATTTSPVYRMLGLDVGIVQESSKPHERRAAYDAPITYLADKQAIFDHLKDRLVSPIWPRTAGLILDDLISGNTQNLASHTPSQKTLAIDSAYRHDWAGRVVQRGLFAAIIDEADSVLIDDAVTPAVISGSESDDAFDTTSYTIAASLARAMEQGRDYTVDLRLRRAVLTDAGREALAAHAHNLPAFWSGPLRREELLTQALCAKEIYKLGEDYIIREGKVEIVDRSTGRVLPGRQWQLGVHQAVEAKEHVKISRERHTTARVSYQDFFQRYQHLSGMTGTASEVASELWRWYRLPVAKVPTHKPIARTRARDRVHSTIDHKFSAVADRVQSLHSSGRPVLVGTRSITASEHLAAVLRERGVMCDVLNADREAEEASIVARAGRTGAVTVATNMAGRGTDIQLDTDSRAAGGLAVLATEHNDESRVDRQLFGRSGRQGDPGSAETFVSLQDAIIHQHGLKSLAALTRLTLHIPILNHLCASILWSGAQWAASRKWKSLRAESAKLESWQDMALHQRTR